MTFSEENPLLTIPAKAVATSPVRAPAGLRLSAPSDGVNWQTILFTTIAAVGPCLLVGLYSSNSRPGSVERVALCAALLTVAAMFAAAGSTLLLDFLLIIVVINRELRRLLDWGEGLYDTAPLLSLLPLAIAGIMALIVAARWYELSSTTRQAGGYLLAAFIYGFGVGFVRNGFPALYAMVDWLTPLVMLFYCILQRPSAALIQRWATVLAALGVLAGTYGLYQWIDPPPWDAAWVNWSGMWSSMGAPRPYELSICSTLESRGPAAMFFAATTAVLVALPALRRAGGALLAVIPGTALLLTQARTGLIYLVLSLLASAVFNRRGGVKIILSLLIAGGLTAAVIAQQEESSKIFDRVDTLSHVEDDGSANGRVDIARDSVMNVITNPIGFGFGSGGTVVRLSTGQTEAVTENGYLEILSTLGAPGTLLFGLGLAQLVRVAVQKRRLATALEPTTHLGLGMLVALVPALLVANLLASAHGAYVWIFLSRHLAVAPHATAGPGRRE